MLVALLAVLQNEKQWCKTDHTIVFILHVPKRIDLRELRYLFLRASRLNDAIIIFDVSLIHLCTSLRPSHGPA